MKDPSSLGISGPFAPSLHFIDRADDTEGIYSDKLQLEEDFGPDFSPQLFYPTQETTCIQKFKARLLQNKVISELYGLSEMAIPLSVSNFFQSGMGLTAVMFVGHLGDDELAASSLSSMYCNISGLSVVSGLLTGIDTLGSQAYGAENFERVGIILQRALVILALYFLVLIPLWLPSYYFLCWNRS